MEELLYALLRYAIGLGASDIHFGEGVYPIVRICGELRRMDEMKMPEELSGIAAQPWPELLLAAARYRMPKTACECDFAWELPGGERFRVNLYRSGGQLSAALRIIPRNVPSCDALGLPESVQGWACLPNGLVLVTGATGSGKTTTLAAVLQEINRTRRLHILTLEDPVEYRFTSERCLIHQREIGRDTEDFASGLRSALREDPDVIMVGELRDTETMSIAVTAAETGHLVFATLHTRSAAETIDRIIDSFPERQQRQVRLQLAGSLQAIAAQQLVPDLSGGRVAAVEILQVTPAVRNLIREGKTQQINSYIQTGSKYGMQTMAGALQSLRDRGRIL